MSIPKKARAMTSALKQYQGIHSVAVIGNYLPHRYGIATFTIEYLIKL